MKHASFFSSLRPVWVQIGPHRPEAATCLHYDGQVTVDERDLLGRFGAAVQIQRRGHHATAHFRSPLTEPGEAAVLHLAELYRSRSQTSGPVRPPVGSKPKLLSMPSPRHAPAPQLRKAA